MRKIPQENVSRAGMARGKTKRMFNKEHKQLGDSRSSIQDVLVKGSRMPQGLNDSAKAKLEPFYGTTTTM